MARRYWTCRKCKYRNERTASKKCLNCEALTKPVTKKPAHEAGLLSYEEHVEINQVVHGLDENTCGICKRPRASEGFRLDREHAHFGGYYPRGLAHWQCNKILGQIEFGRDSEEWLENCLEFVRRARLFNEAKSA
jgi:hypothetical protein